MIRTNKRVAGVLCVLGLLSASLPAMALNQRDAVAVWLFDEGSGARVVDATGNGNDGQVTGNVRWVSGRFGSALELDGTSGCIQTGKRLLQGADAYTITAWVRPRSLDAFRIGLLGENDAAEFGFIKPGTLEFWSPVTGWTDAPYPHAMGEWHFVAAIVSPLAIRIFVDTRYVERTGPWSSEPFAGGTLNMAGCGVFDSAGNWFNGALDDVGIFNRALTEDELAQIRSSGLPETLKLKETGQSRSSTRVRIDPATAIAIWLMDDGSGQVAVDATGMGNDGQLVGTTRWVNGRFGKALEFDGSSGCIRTGRHLFASNTAYTITGWVKPRSLNAFRIGLIGADNLVELGFISPGVLQLWTPQAGETNAPYPFTAGEWHFVAAVITPESIRVLVDGSSVHREGPWLTVARPDSPVNIAGCGVFDSAGNWFDGTLDDVAIFKTALSDDALASIRTNGLRKVTGRQGR